MGDRLSDLLLKAARFYVKPEFVELSGSNFESTIRCMIALADLCDQHGEKDRSEKLNDSIDALISKATGNLKPEK